MSCIDYDCVSYVVYSKRLAVGNDRKNLTLCKWPAGFSSDTIPNLSAECSRISNLLGQWSFGHNFYLTSSAWNVLKTC